jgi:3D (Asp-Asp-Asp) domain-containing protein
VRLAAHAIVAITVLGLTAWSAVLVKESQVRTPLVQAEHKKSVTKAPMIEPISEAQAEQFFDAYAAAEPVADGTVRWFDGRKVRPVRTIWMRVTAYSPDARSCGKWADGQTATMHSVWTNAMRLVAADTRVLPYRSLITVPGYADSEIVPVLDCGGAIKGNRLDVLFPTHKIARRWGVRDLPITVWAYEDENEG